jgi:O-acetyl-ADP-ribose deacetylase
VGDAVVEVLEVDITTLEVDAITNAANAQLQHGGGVAGAIARAAGPELERESRAKAPIAVGDTVATTGGSLPARWVIHAATMATPGGTTDADVVRRCTAATLWKAEELGARSLALVAFGTGVGGFPVAEAAEIEVDEVRRHLDSGSKLQRVVFAVRGAEAREAFERELAR